MSVTDSDVRKIIEVAADFDTAPFIQTAKLIAEEELQGKGLSDERLDQIVVYLAAHFVVITDEKGGMRRSKMGDADESYVVPKATGVGYSSTRFGQQALILDKTGTLAQQTAHGGLRARFTVVEQDMGT